MVEALFLVGWPPISEFCLDPSLAVLLVLLSATMSPDTELCQEREDQPLSELNIDQLCREIKFAFKVRKGVLEYYIKMFKFWLEGLYLNTNGNPSSVFLLISRRRA